MKKLMILGLITMTCALVACGGGKPGGNDNKKSSGGGSGDDVLRNPVPQQFKSKNAPDLTSADLIAQGKELYNDPAKGNCVSCHGDAGKGDGLLAPNYSDPKVADLTTAAFQDAVSDQYIFWRIKEPVASRANPASGMLGFPGGTDEQIWSIVAYVRSLKAD